ncbi:MAG TPA: radical SAM protein [Desulfosalsimonadaceae bacterium]|nr:radical SAM protein [Desulfosalsimonadaceae bacterium]
MSSSQHKVHDFSAKLRQASVIDGFRKYVDWQRSVRKGGSPDSAPDMAPVSINLDLTTACNFACPHCVDSEIINSGGVLPLEEVKKSLDTLRAHGLLSVILLGGGEPTLYKNFGEVVRYMKDKGLQVGIVTNGSRLERIAEIAHLLEKHDWLRLSLDAASQETFDKLHRPKTRVLLQDILANARDVKAQNPELSLGYSFVIMWEGLHLNGVPIAPNLHEMKDAAGLAAEHNFDYISFKPCLIRLPDLHQESLLDNVDREKEQRIIENVGAKLAEAKDGAGERIKILESVNLIAMLEHRAHEMKKQPETCHMQVFNSVLAPAGIFHCPAFRGVDTAKIAEADGYAGEEKFQETLTRLRQSIASFNARKECDRIACFYNHVNWWMEDFIRSGKPAAELEQAEDDNFFF